MADNVNIVAPRVDSCDLCGREFSIEDLKFSEAEKLSLCSYCFAEKESCGCSDDE